MSDPAGYPFLNAYLLVIGLWLLSLLIQRAVRRRSKEQPMGELYLPALGFAILGLSLGIIVGNSRDPVVEAAITGLMTIYGGFVVYIFGKDAKPAQRQLAGVALILLPIALAYGVHLGASYRIVGEGEIKKRDQWLEKDLAEYKTDLELYKYAQEQLLDRADGQALSRGRPQASDTSKSRR